MDLSEGKRVTLKQDIHYRVSPSLTDTEVREHLKSKPVLMMSYEAGTEGKICHIKNYLPLCIAVEFPGSLFSIVFTGEKQINSYLEV